MNILLYNNMYLIINICIRYAGNDEFSYKVSSYPLIPQREENTKADYFTIVTNNDTIVKKDK